MHGHSIYAPTFVRSLPVSVIECHRIEERAGAHRYASKYRIVATGSKRMSSLRSTRLRISASFSCSHMSSAVATNAALTSLVFSSISDIGNEKVGLARPLPVDTVSGYYIAPSTLHPGMFCSWRGVSLTHCTPAGASTGTSEPPRATI